MDKTNIINLSRDIQRGITTFSVEDKTYTKTEATDILRQALISANGGKTTIDRKTLRRNRAELFDIIEELVPAIVNEGLTGSEFWNNYVDERNVAYGDKPEFVIPDNSTFIVSKIADGIATPRRQRIGKSSVLTVPTSVHAVRIYDEFSRFMAGRIDWNELCNKVGKSFNQEIWKDIYTAFSGITASTIGLNSNYVINGSYSEAQLNTLVEHVEAATGENAVIIGTKTALAKCSTAVVSDKAKDSMYDEGFYGKHNGTPMVMIKQVHYAGTDNFILDNNTVYVIAGGDKFIKFVNEGDAYIDDRDTTRNADRTIEYFMEMRWGVAVAVAGKIGKYKIA